MSDQHLNINLQIPAGHKLLVGIIRCGKHINIAVDTCAGEDEFRTRIKARGSELLLACDLLHLIYLSSLNPLERLLIDSQQKPH